MTDNLYFDTLHESLEANKQVLLETFTARASMLGWPEDIIADINMRFDDANISLEYAENLSRDISNLEYGSDEVPARAAIRNFTGDVGESISDIMINKGIDTLFDRGVFS